MIQTSLHRQNFDGNPVFALAHSSDHQEKNTPGKQVAVNFHQLYPEKQPQLPKKIVVSHVFQAAVLVLHECQWKILCISQDPPYSAKHTLLPNTVKPRASTSRGKQTSNQNPV